MEIKKLLDNIYIIPEREFDANMYLVVEDNEILNLIDTGTGLNVTKTIREIKEQFDITKLKRIILTHCHIDHSGGLHRLVKKFSPEVCVFEEEAPKNCVFDFTNLTYLNSKSIGYIADWQAKIAGTGGKLVIFGVQENIFDILDVVGLTKIIDLVDNITMF